MNSRSLPFFALALALSACIPISGITAYTGKTLLSDGTRVEYRFAHPGLDIVVLVENSDKLIEPISIGTDKSDRFQHIIEYGDVSSPDRLLIEGRYRKNLRLNDVCYEAIHRGVLTVEAGKVTLDGRALETRRCA